MESSPTYLVKKDGAAWCATGSNFIDLQESLSGFGSTPHQALESLVNQEYETDEIIATLKADNEVMKLALLEVIKVLESDDSAIVDTVWVSTGQPETLRDHCYSAVYGESYNGEEPPL